MKSKRKNSWKFEKFWQFYEKNVDFFLKFTDIFLSFQTQLRIQECAWDKFFNSWEDFENFLRRIFACSKEKEIKYLRKMLRIVSEKTFTKKMVVIISQS